MTRIYIEVSEHIEVSERHHDQTLPITIPFGLLKKKTVTVFAHWTIANGWRGAARYIHYLL